MSTKRENLKEGNRQFWLYKIKKLSQNPQSLIVTETPIIMDRWKLTYYKLVRNGEKIEMIEYYYTTLPNVSTKVTIDESDIGKLYRGTNMVLDRQDKSYYINALKNEYNQRIDAAKLTILRYTEYLAILSDM